MYLTYLMIFYLVGVCLAIKPSIAMIKRVLPRVEARLHGSAATIDLFVVVVILSLLWPANYILWGILFITNAKERR